MCETDYTELLPTEPPEGVIDWLRGKGRLGDDYLVYRSGSVYNPLEGRNVRAVRCHCTACNETFYEKYIKPECSKALYHAPFGFEHPDTGELIMSDCEINCPECGAKVQVRHIGCFGVRNGSKIENAFPITIHNVDGNLAILWWCVERRIDRTGRDYILTHPYIGYLFTGDKKIQFNGYSCNFYKTYYTDEWRQLKTFRDRIGQITTKAIYAWDADILNGTAAENSKLDKYIACAEDVCPVSYMSLYQRYPNIENLVMSGWGSFLNYKIITSGTCDYQGIYTPSIGKIRGLKMSKAKPADILGLDKAEMRYIKAHKWSNKTTELYTRVRKQGIELEEAEKFSTDKKYAEARKLLIGTGANIPRAMRYVEKQRRKFPDSKGIINIQYLVDYWDMAKQNGDDLSDDAIRYPHKLTALHNAAVKLLNPKTETDPKLEAKFKKRYKELEEFCYESNGISIHPAMSEREMIIEGKLLNHCVASYARRHAEGQTTIFFIRYTSAPDVPLSTLEYDFKNIKVAQNRAYHNDPPPKEVKAFENEWVKHVEQTIEKNKKKRSAA